MTDRRRKSIVAVGTLLAACLALELVVRLSQGPPVYIGQLPFDPELGYVMPPSYDGAGFDERGRFPLRLNSLGFRGPELPPEGAPKPAGVTRVLFVGDSFLTPTVREEELLQSVCERALLAHGIAVESYTLCCNDYGTAQELLLLERHGERVQPDVIVLEVYAPNDLANNSLELAGQVETSAGDYVRPYLVPRGAGRFERTWAQPMRAFLRGHLRSFALLDCALITRAKEGSFAWYSPWPLVQAQAKGAPPSLPEWMEVFRAHGPEDPWEHAWNVTRELVLAVGERARALDARVLVLVVPASMQVELSALTFRAEAQLEQLGAETLASLDRNLPERRIAGFCREAGLDARFALEPLREAAARNGRTNYLGDGHLNGRGNALAGALVADWIAGTDEHPTSRADAPLTAPVKLVPPDESAPRWLDLTDESSANLLGFGWSAYTAPDTGRFSWVPSARSQMLLPLRDGERFVVEGWLPPHAKVPSRVSIEVPGRKRVVRPLQATGPFRIELTVPDGKATGRLTVVTLNFSETFHPTPEERSIGAFLTGVGCPPDADEHAPARLELERGIELVEQGDNADGIEVLRAALGAAPDDAELVPLAHSWIGAALTRLGDPEGALRECQLALELAPGDPWLHYACGVAWYTLGELERARESFTHAIESEPRHIKSLQWRALVLRDLDDDRAAVEDLTRALECIESADEATLASWRGNRRSLLLKTLNLRLQAFDDLGLHEEAMRDRLRYERIFAGGAL